MHGTATYSCDDTRDCIIQFCLPDDEHLCSKHVEAWNKLIVKFSASSWLILRNKRHFTLFFFDQETFDIRAEDIYNSLRCLPGGFSRRQMLRPHTRVCDFLCMWSVSSRRQPEGHFAKRFALLLYRLCGSPWNYSREHINSHRTSSVHESISRFCARISATYSLPFCSKCLSI